MQPIPKDELATIYGMVKDTKLLSGRELEILWLWSLGAGVRKTSLLLDVHQSTVREYRRRIKGKLTSAMKYENGRVYFNT